MCMQSCRHARHIPSRPVRTQTPKTSSSDRLRRPTKTPLAFELSAAELNAIREGPCAYCGLGERNGVDRTDNDIGYTLDNCVPCCSECNYMKNSFPLGVFLGKCEAIAARAATGAFDFFPDVKTNILSLARDCDAEEDDL